MLFPLGLLSQGGGAAAGAFEQIQTISGTGSSGVIDFTSIPSTYKNLQIRFTAKNSASNQGILLTLNNVTTANYTRHYLRGDSINTGAGVAFSANNINLLDAMATSTTANVFSMGIIDLQDYAVATKNKTVTARYGLVEAYSTSRVYLASGFLNATTAISRVTLTTSGGNFATGSRFTLYGIKG